MASSGPGAVLSSGIRASGCSGSAAKVPVRDPAPPCRSPLGQPHVGSLLSSTPVDDRGLAEVLTSPNKSERDRGLAKVLTSPNQ